MRFFDALTSISTALLLFLAYVQWRGNRRLQRAYISAEPHGVRSMRGAESLILSHIAFHNVGQTAAREITCRVKTEWSSDRKFNPPRIENEELEGTYIIPARGRMIQGSPTATYPATEPREYLYVWGSIHYQDGFGRRRFTDFCHRYHRNSMVRDDGFYKADSDEARHHEHGNDADRDPPWWQFWKFLPPLRGKHRVS